MNIRNIMHGRDADVHLVAGDIVWVPVTIWTDLQNYARAAIITAAQAVAIQEGLNTAGKLGIGERSPVSISAGSVQ